MLELKNICKNYGQKKVLKNITFSIQPGNIVSLLGANGSGKTTTFKIIMNLIKPDDGIVLFNNKIMNNNDFGFLPEERSMYYDCSIFQQLRFITRLNNINDNQAESLIDEYLNRFHLSSEKHLKIGKLSKGNQQKVALIMAIIKNPELLILDEPFTGLDIGNIKIFKNILVELKREKKIIIVSSHIYQPVNDICDRYLYLKDGIIELDKTKDEILGDCRKVIYIDNIDVDFNIEGILSESIEEEKQKYIVKDNQSAKQIIKEVQKNNIGYEYRSLKIEDLIK